MKRIALALCLFSVLVAFATAQTATPTPTPVPAATGPANIYAAGISYNPGASPAIAGTGLYARQLIGGTYAFTAIDALPATLKPFTVDTNISVGVAQKVATIAGVPIYVPTAAGISWSGKNTGWACSTGALAWIKIKGQWAIAPNVRVLKSSVSGGAGYGVVGGFLLGWGK